MKEKRRYERVHVRFEVRCRPAGEGICPVCHGRAVNACPGGLYFNTSQCQCECGKIVELEMSIPPSNGTLQRPGRISAFGRLLRTERFEAAVEPKDYTDEYYGVAVQFCRSPKLAR